MNSKFKHGTEFVSERLPLGEPRSPRRNSLEEGRSSESILPFTDTRLTTIEDPQQKEKKRNPHLVCLGIFALVCSFILLVLVASRNFPKQERGNSLSASVYVSNFERPSKNCEKTPHGCCEVYDHCHLHTDNNFTYRHETVYSSVETKNDEEGSNCPRLVQMVRKYNVNYYPSEDRNFECLSSEFGCCTVDISCDQYVHYGIEMSHKKDINASGMGPPTLINLNIVKLNSEGLNCPQVDRIVYYYNVDYPSVPGIVSSIILLFLGFLVMMHCIFQCIEICSHR